MRLSNRDMIEFNHFSQERRYHLLRTLRLTANLLAAQKFSPVCDKTVDKECGAFQALTTLRDQPSNSLEKLCIDERLALESTTRTCIIAYCEYIDRITKKEQFVFQVACTISMVGHRTINLPHVCTLNALMSR